MITYGIAYPSPTHEHNPSLINRLIDKAFSISRIKSSHALTPTALMEAAWTLNPTATPLTPLVEVLPLHYDALFSGLSDIHQDSAALEAKGIGRPLVLVVEDTHGVIASMFRAAGADVATSDPLPSTVSNIPHFVGAPDVLLDTGFDLIIRLNTDSSPSTFRTPRAPKFDVPYLVYETSYLNPTSLRTAPPQLKLFTPLTTASIQPNLWALSLVPAFPRSNQFASLPPKKCLYFHTMPRTPKPRGLVTESL